LILTKFAVKNCICAQALIQTKVIYSSDLFTYNAKYFRTLPKEKWQWRSFTNSLHSMPKLVHEVVWQAPQCMDEVSWQ